MSWIIATKRHFLALAADVSHQSHGSVHGLTLFVDEAALDRVVVDLSATEQLPALAVEREILESADLAVGLGLQLLQRVPEHLAEALVGLQPAPVHREPPEPDGGAFDDAPEAILTPAECRGRGAALTLRKPKSRIPSERCNGERGRRGGCEERGFGAVVEEASAQTGDCEQPEQTRDRNGRDQIPAECIAGFIARRQRCDGRQFLVTKQRTQRCEQQRSLRSHGGGRGQGDEGGLYVVAALEHEHPGCAEAPECGVGRTARLRAGRERDADCDESHSHQGGRGELGDPSLQADGFAGQQPEGECREPQGGRQERNDIPDQRTLRALARVAQQRDAESKYTRRTDRADEDARGPPARSGTHA